MTQADRQINAAFVSPLRQLGGKMLDVLMPPQCLNCGALIEQDGALCLDCWQEVTFISLPHCACCGLPFEFDDGDSFSDQNLCGACIAHAPVFNRARAVLAYDDASKPFILSFKHADRTEAAATFARWMARAGVELVSDADVIVPVPLHWIRLFRRRYNQSALLSVQLGKISGIPVIPDLLVRKRRTPSQGRLSPSQRRRNVSGAFAIRNGKLDAIRGKRVLLIDDVITTGATASAVTRTLLKGGASAVDVLTLGRVLRPFPS